MHNSTEPAAPSEEPATIEPPPCPCGNPGHQPVRIGETFATSGSGALDVLQCPESTLFGLGRAS